MARIKPILPSLREKKRYLVFEIISGNKKEDFKAVSRAIWACSLQFLGEYGVANAGIWLLPDKYNDDNKMGIIKVGHKYVNHLKSALTMVDKIDNHEVIVKSVGVSGILKKAENKYIAG